MTLSLRFPRGKRSEAAKAKSAIMETSPQVPNSGNPSKGKGKAGERGGHGVVVTGECVWEL